jgi:parallel beta helix pectate lyase-like protein/pectate lyase-like protein
VTALYTASGAAAAELTRILRKRADRRAIGVQAVDDRVLDVRGFGARGDGSADDAPALQLAVDELRADGGTIVLPAGTYQLGAKITINANRLRLLGEPGCIVRTVEGDHGIELGNGVDFLQYLGLEGIVFSRINIGVDHCVRVRKVAQFSIERCHFVGGEVGLSIDQGTVGTVQACRFGEGCATDGLKLSNCALVSVVGCYFENSEAGHEAHVEVAPGCSSLSIVGCSFGSGVGRAVQLAGGPSTDVAISGNALRECKYGFRVAGGSSRVAITGNVMPGADPGTGVLLEADSSGCAVVGNTFSGWATAVSDLGTGNIIASNAGV